MSSPNSAKHPSQPSIYEGKPNFMSWLGKIFKGGSSSRGVPGGQQPQLLGDENTALRTPVRSLDDRSRANRDKEDLDLAVARSQSEDLERSNGYIRIDNDLAKLLHDSHNSSLYPLYAPPYAPRDYRVCGGCCREIGYGNYLRRMGTFFHPECFCCHACGYPITEQEFSVSGNKTHHKLCFKELTHPKCEVCHQFVPANGAGMFDYIPPILVSEMLPFTRA